LVQKRHCIPQIRIVPVGRQRKPQAGREGLARKRNQSLPVRAEDANVPSYDIETQGKRNHDGGLEAKKSTMLCKSKIEVHRVKKPGGAKDFRFQACGGEEGKQRGPLNGITDL